MKKLGFIEMNMGRNYVCGIPIDFPWNKLQNMIEKSPMWFNFNKKFRIFDSANDEYSDKIAASNFSKNDNKVGREIIDDIWASLIDEKKIERKTKLNVNIKFFLKKIFLYFIFIHWKMKNVDQQEKKLQELFFHASRERKFFQPRWGKIIWRLGKFQAKDILIYSWTSLLFPFSSCFKIVLNFLCYYFGYKKPWWSFSDSLSLSLKKFNCIWKPKYPIS